MFARHVCLAIAATLLAGAAVDAGDPKVDPFGDALPPHAVLRIGTTRFRHGGPITAILFAADGKTVFTASEDRTVSRWNVETGQELVRYADGHKLPVLTLALAADGKTLFTCAPDPTKCGTFCTWEVGVAVPEATTVLPLRPRPQESFIVPVEQTAVLGPNGKSLASGADFGIVNLMDAAKNGAVRREFRGNAALRSLAFSPDANFLAANSDESGVTVWDVKADKKRAAFGKGTSLACVALGPDADLLVGGDFDNRVHLWDVKKETELATLEGHAAAPTGKLNGVFCVAFSPDGKWLASGAADATVRLWDVAKRKPIAVLKGHADRVTALAFSPDSKQLLSGGADNELRLWDVATAKEVRPATEPAGPILSLALHHDGQLLATVHAPNKLRLWDATTGKPGAALPGLRDTATALLFLPDDKTLVSGEQDLFQSWDLKTGKATDWQEKATRGIGPALAVDGAGKTLVSANPSGRVVTLWDVKQGKPAHTLENSSNVVALALSADGEWAAAGGSASIRLWQLTDGWPQRDLIAHPGGTTAVAFSKDGRLLASAGKDRMIRLWEVLGGKERRAFGGQPGWVRALAFDPKGRLLATGSTDGAVRLWDVRSGKLIREMTGHRGGVTGIVFTPSGERLISTSVDATALVWEVKDVRAEEIKPLQLKAEELDRCWKELADLDVAVAAAAIQLLARAPEQAVPLLRERVVSLSDAQLQRLIEKLDSDDFATRTEAKAKLSDAGKNAEPALRQAVQNKPSAEVAARLKELLAELAAKGVPPAQMRLLRSVEVLEMLDTKAAREVLQTIADGPKDAELTKQAKAALERLKTP